MSIRVVRLACGPSALMAVAALALVGCEGAAGKPASEPAPPALVSPPPSAVPAPASRPLTAAQLVAAALPGEESPDAYGHPASVRKPQRGDRKSGPSHPACGQLLAAAHARQPSRPAPAVVEQVFNWKGQVNGGDSTLASYGNSGAVAAFAQVREGLSTCRYFESPGAAGTYKGTVTVGAAPRLGDEAVQFEITAPTELGPHVTQYTVVRTGSVVATFTKLSVGGLDVREFPPALIDRQISLLRQAQS
ncbi:hypothetical protein [Streptomyces sp. NPDC007369]|uniref:hypothetical protein n=1 Tax=Streptomyces sp. NPDC007369 TaxID=3154589 RepID=UPI0033DEAB41